MDCGRHRRAAFRLRAEKLLENQIKHETGETHGCSKYAHSNDSMKCTEHRAHLAPLPDEHLLPRCSAFPPPAVSANLLNGCARRTAVLWFGRRYWDIASCHDLTPRCRRPTMSLNKNRRPKQSLLRSHRLDRSATVRSCRKHRHSGRRCFFRRAAGRRSLRWRSGWVSGLSDSGADHDQARVVARVCGRANQLARSRGKQNRDEAEHGRRQHLGAAAVRLHSTRPST